jgi:DNA polymerase III delta prime subunit
MSGLIGCTLQVDSGDCPHLLFYGPAGAGKHTLITCLLREMFGAGAEKVREQLDHELPVTTR